jgi:hypothetical protein
MIALLCTAMPALGESLEQLYEAARKNDIELQILTITLENRESAIQRGNLDKNLGVDAGTGEDGAVLGVPLTDSGSMSLTMDPYVSVSLPEGIETIIRLSTDVDLGLADGQEFDLNPVLSVTQPLNPLLGLEASEKGKRLADAISLFQARLALWNRERAIKKKVIGNIRQVIGLDKSVGDAERAVLDLEDELSRARALGTYGEDSTELVQLENGLRAAGRALELAIERSELAMRELEMTTGQPVAEMPRPASPVELGSQSFDIGMHPVVQSSSMAVEKAEVALEEYVDPYIPAYSFGVSYALPDPEAHTIGASVGAGFEHFSIGATVSASVGPESSESLRTKVSFHWSLPDNRAKDLLAGELEQAVEMAKLRYESTIKSITLSAEALALQTREIASRRANLSERIALEERRLQDTTKRYELGVVTEALLRAAEWNVEKLKMDMTLIEFEALTLVLDLDSLEYDG